eukprot:2301568-Pleurochrysis_carterae.AAC.3
MNALLLRVNSVCSLCRRDCIPPLQEAAPGMRAQANGRADKLLRSAGFGSGAGWKKCCKLFRRSEAAESDAEAAGSYW